MTALTILAVVLCAYLLHRVTVLELKLHRQSVAWRHERMVQHHRQKKQDEDRAIQREQDLEYFIGVTRSLNILIPKSGIPFHHEHKRLLPKEL